MELGKTQLWFKNIGKKLMKKFVKFLCRIKNRENNRTILEKKFNIGTKGK